MGTVTPAALVRTVTFLTAYVPELRSPEKHLASARARADLQDCCWRTLLRVVEPVTRPFELPGVALHVGRSWKDPVSYERVCADIQTKQFGSLLPCTWQVLFANRVVYTDAATRSWLKRLVLAVEPVICETCDSQMRCSLQSEHDVFEVAICVSKNVPTLLETMHVFGVLPTRHAP